MTFVVDVFNNWWLWQQMARLESDISWMWKNKTGFSGRMLQEVINLLIETKNQNFHFLIMISRARSAWRGGQGVWLPGPATHSETRGNHRWGQSELWIIFLRPARRFPNLKMVVDHIAKPLMSLGQEGLKGWRWGFSWHSWQNIKPTTHTLYFGTKHK